MPVTTEHGEPTVTGRPPHTADAHARRHARRQFRRHRRLAWLDRELRALHGRFRQGILAYIVEGSLPSLLTAPLIYLLLIPMLLLDAAVTLFQRVAFPIYGIAPVRRRAYFAIDRHRLAYLNAIEKVNCTYCSYANGLFAYVREVAGRTEQYWCPIRHARAIRDPHARYPHFLEYGDAAGYRRELSRLRRGLAPTVRMR